MTKPTKFYDWHEMLSDEDVTAVIGAYGTGKAFGMAKLARFKCPYINYKKAEMAGTMYYCDFDKMEFEEMTAHCSHCEMYEYLLRKAEREIFGGLV